MLGEWIALLVWSNRILDQLLNRPEVASNSWRHSGVHVGGRVSAVRVALAEQRSSERVATGRPVCRKSLVRVLPLLRRVHGWIQKVNAVAVGAQEVQQFIETAGSHLMDAAIHDRHVA